MFTRKTALLGSASAVALLVASGPAAMAAGETKVEISGYIKLDAIYQFGQSLNDGTSFTLGSLASGNTPVAEGRMRIHARQSRVRFKTMTPTDMGNMTTYMEMDFESGASSSATNRSNGSLRIAYGTIGGFLAGQTWSNFTGTWPSTLDFAGPVGVPYKRNPMLKYTFDASPNTKVAVSIEENRPIGSGGPRQPNTPDFTGSLSYSGGGANLKFMGIMRNLNVDSGAAGGAKDSTLGWGLGLNGTVSVLGKDSIVFDVTGGQGIGDYLEQVYTNAYIVDGAGKIHAPSQWAAVIGYDHAWNDKAHSTVSWGHYENEDKTLGGTTLALQSLDSFHVNYMWSPVPSTNFGVEFMHGIKGFNGAGRKDNTDDAVQFSAQYLF